ncbi:type VI secretion system baseplate subunit TssF [Plasticicumulans acidivorans]|uniref:Type VI secretion system protein ImpG n=1 Tax=Plasticicumulans acidivorans TaxID=886464 RepID=A0A317MZH2_9GAMM|nr:type VI secretion system baseplate subunit TssF [Plasticicumulans acidivorans]PWV64781.1 type VI secretion system protein ImpG [Plasticicumulans acidivorans]
MDPRLLQYYNRELQHLRETAGEFAEEFPKIASRLSLSGFECADPYVERLLEGCAFLSARVQMKLDAEFPAFTQHLLEMVYPHYLAPTPSMLVAQLQPDLNEGGLAKGFTVARGASLKSVLGKNEATACDYRSGQPVTLWPLELTDAEYFGNVTAVLGPAASSAPRARAGLRLRLRVTAGLKFEELTLERLPLYLRGADQLPFRLYEQLLGNAVQVLARPAERPAPWFQWLGRESLRPLGFDDDEALLPLAPRSFQGYRLLGEYFAFPQRFLFVELGGLGPVVRRCSGSELEILVLFDRLDPLLEGVLKAANFALFCTPAINLFPKRADRIHLNDRSAEYHVVPDRTRPLDLEVHSLERVTGHGTGEQAEQPFLPFYCAHDRIRRSADGAYFTLRRSKRMLSAKARLRGPRTGYIGQEVFIALVDAQAAPYRHDLRQLSLELLCTNRDLPLTMPLGTGRTDFTLDSGAPVGSIRCVVGPTRPRPSVAENDVAWRLISHLSLNYLTLADSDPQQGAVALRELLRLYADTSDPAAQKQVDGLLSIQAEPVTRRIPLPGPIAFGRGVALTLNFDEGAYSGAGVFLFGAVLERFLARYVSINSFTETVTRTLERGEIMRWPVRMGARALL